MRTIVRMRRTVTADPLPRLTTAQAAARLGIKPSTLYAYVSRGVIASARAEQGGSTFDALDVESLAGSRRSGRDRSSGALGAVAGEGTPLMVLESDITALQDDDLFFRGVRATELARDTSFAAAATLLWTARLPAADAAIPFAGAEEVAGRARAARAHLGPAARAVDQLIVSVLVAGSSDPLRHDLSPEAVQTAARRMIACMVDALADVGAPASDTASVAERLWPKLTAEPADAADIDLLNAALVLGMDHDLAVSTLAARVAASARSDPYAGVAAALSAFDGPLHGSASVAAAELLAETIESGRPERALARQVRDGRGTPGFGHLIYRQRDPRAAFLLERMRRLPRYAASVQAVDLLTASVQERLARPANVDLALAAIATAGRMRSDAGQIVFAVSRTAGWVAHILDEYTQTPMRLRPQSRYVGVTPHPVRVPVPASR